MVDIAVKTETLGPDSNQGFIVKPSDITEVGCTLDLALTTGAVADGVIPAGTHLGGPTTAGTFGLYASGAADGTEEYAGPLFDTIPTRGKTAGNVGASRIVVGAVYAAKLPGDAVTAPMKAALTTIAFV